jgi:predicted CopG family antitoxin
MDVSLVDYYRLKKMKIKRRSAADLVIQGLGTNNKEHE